MNKHEHFDTAFFEDELFCIYIHMCDGCCRCRMYDHTPLPFRQNVSCRKRGHAVEIHHRTPHQLRGVSHAAVRPKEQKPETQPSTRDGQRRTPGGKGEKRRALAGAALGDQLEGGCLQGERGSGWTVDRRGFGPRSYTAKNKITCVTALSGQTPEGMRQEEKDQCHVAGDLFPT